MRSSKTLTDAQFFVFLFFGSGNILIYVLVIDLIIYSVSAKKDLYLH